MLVHVFHACNAVDVGPAAMFPAGIQSTLSDFVDVIDDGAVHEDRPPPGMAGKDFFHCVFPPDLVFRCCRMALATSYANVQTVLVPHSVEIGGCDPVLVLEMQPLFFGAPDEMDNVAGGRPHQCHTPVLEHLTDGVGPVPQESLFLRLGVHDFLVSESPRASLMVVTAVS